MNEPKPPSPMVPGRLPTPGQPQTLRPSPPAPGLHPQPAGPQPARPTGLPPKVAGLPVPGKTTEVDLDPIGLVDEPASGAPAPSKIKAFGIAGAHAAQKYKRPTTVTGTGICRVRTFHGRLSEEGVSFMDEKINEWLDQHTDIEVKFVTTTIGTFEGKIREPALVVNVWY